MQEQAVTYTYIVVQGAHCETKAKTTTKPKNVNNTTMMNGQKCKVRMQGCR